jgi:hypothetical protein
MLDRGYTEESKDSALTLDKAELPEPMPSNTGDCSKAGAFISAVISSCAA